MPQVKKRNGLTNGLSVALSAKEYENLQQVAKQQSRSMGFVMRQALAEYMQRYYE